MSKICESGGFLRNMLGNLGKKGKDLAIPLARDNLPGLISSLTSNANIWITDNDIRIKNFISVPFFKQYRDY